MNKIIVVGGGASGLVAGITAARQGCEVVILEKLNRIGKKILATGNGRCNIGNNDCSLNRFHSTDMAQVEKVLQQFSPQDTTSFFEELGLWIKEEQEGKLYPFSDQASSVLDVLRYEVERLNIEVVTECQVTDILNQEQGMVVKSSKGDFQGDKIILAVGGMASPNLGSTGDGYKLLKKMGHSIKNTYPALIKINLKGPYFRHLKGVKFIGECKIYNEIGQERTESGEILFFEQGLSGPPILQISRIASESINKGLTCLIDIDLFPSETEKSLFLKLYHKMNLIGYKSIGDGLIGFINKKLIQVVLKEAGIDHKRSCKSISKKELSKIVNTLKKWTFEVSSIGRWKDAQVTAGGACMSEFNAYGLNSLKEPNLYVIGELLDVDGDCGGYNLHWAWATGYISAIHASYN